MKIEIVLLIALVNLAFWSGVAITKLRGDSRKAKFDTNNLGDKVRQIELKLFYVAMMVTPDAKRQEVLNAMVRRLT